MVVPEISHLLLYLCRLNFVVFPLDLFRQVSIVCSVQVPVKKFFALWPVRPGKNRFQGVMRHEVRDVEDPWFDLSEPKPGVTLVTTGTIAAVAKV